MKKCRYIPDSQLILITSEQKSVICKALVAGKVKVEGKALRYALQVWQVDASQIVKALRMHLESDRRIFQKRSANNGLILANKVHANVNLFAEEDEDEDIYVELDIRESDVVLILNAHNHDEGLPRLPK